MARFSVYSVTRAFDVTNIIALMHSTTGIVASNAIKPKELLTEALIEGKVTLTS